jgi:cyanophycinase
MTHQNNVNLLTLGVAPRKWRQASVWRSRFLPQLCSIAMLGAVIGVAPAWSAMAEPSHGPAKGRLLISGGGSLYFFRRFLASSGGKNARIVVIPTADSAASANPELLSKYCAWVAPPARCTVLHATDRRVAESEAFVAPLKEATGVWFDGGRQWRLADAYLGARTHREMFNVLERGGVIAGGSAGATIQGSYLVRGSSNPDDPAIMMAPGHETGLGFFTNVAIDQHVDTRKRENDLAVVLKAHPELLGLGLDERVWIDVHGDILTVAGRGRLAVWDGKDHDGKSYYHLQPGDQLNTATRVPTRAVVRKEIALSPDHLRNCTGIYKFSQDKYLIVTLEGDHLSGKNSENLFDKEKMPLYAETLTKFFLKTDNVQIEFLNDKDNAITKLIWHKDGDKSWARRLDPAEVQQMTERLAAKAARDAQRRQDQQPAPGAELALRRYIEALRRGDPKDDSINANFSEHVLYIFHDFQSTIISLGPLLSIEHKGIGDRGDDIYEAQFEREKAEFRISLDYNGKIESVIANKK